jgi:hypothetical protein
MSKTKKKVSRRTRTALLAETSAAHNAADNPLSSPLSEGEDDLADRRSQEATVGAEFDQIGQTADRQDRDDQPRSNKVPGDHDGHQCGQIEDREASSRSREVTTRLRDNTPPLFVNSDQRSELAPSHYSEEENENPIVKYGSDSDARSNRVHAARSENRHQQMPDENIQRALNELNDPQRQPGESRDEYKARLAASARQRRETPIVKEKPREREETTSPSSHIIMWPGKFSGNIAMLPGVADPW